MEADHGKMLDNKALHDRGQELLSAMNVGEGVEKSKPSYTVGGNAN